MKRFLVFIFCLVTLFNVMAQEQKVQHRPYLDQRKFHWGFLFGLHMQDLELKNNGYIDPESGEQWYADVDNYNPGFSVGVLGEMRLNRYLALRLIPTMPLDLKFSAPRHNNYRPYFIAGVNPMLDLTTKKQKALLMKPFDCYIEIGMGCDFYLPFFKLIPELKFCFGLADILKKDRNDLIDNSLQKFTKSLDGASSKMIVLTLYFE